MLYQEGNANDEDFVVCRQKLYALRFTPESIDTSDIEYTDKHTCTGIDSTGLATSYKAIFSNQIKARLLGEDYYRASTSVSGDWQKYKGISGTFKTDKVDDSDRYYYGKTFACTPTYEQETYETNKNDALAYVISVYSKWKDEFKNDDQINNHQKSVVEDIPNEENSEGVNPLKMLVQETLWLFRGTTRYEEDEIFNTGKSYSYASEEAKQLAKEARNYRDFFKNYKKSNNDDIDSKKIKEEMNVNVDNAKVIVQDRENYIVGPITIEYPQKSNLASLKFLYVDSIYIKTDTTGNKKIEPQIICNSDVYPDSGEPFFIKFNANDTKYPTKIDIGFDCVYLDSCESAYTKYKGTGQIRRLKAERKIQTTDTDCPDHYYTSTQKDNDGNVISTTTIHYKIQRYYAVVTNEYVKDYEAQGLAIIHWGGEEEQSGRDWNKISITGSESIDLTMELGGTVWEDTKGGKETENDNIYNENININNQTDKPMSGVIVTLYKNDGTVVKLTQDSNPDNNDKEQIQNPTTTDKNGEYKFTGINSMYQYYVKFTYNSQYYEPVEYVGPKDNENGWGTDNWKINSNGTDVQTERETINARFVSIGSSPNNYISSNSTGWFTKSSDGKYYNKTYSKMDLLGYTLQTNGNYIKENNAIAVIDEFGNLILENHTDEEIRKKIQYVKDCQLESYTGIDNTNKEPVNDLYPKDKTFIIDEELEFKGYLKQGDLKLLLKDEFTNINKQVIPLYEDDNHLYINQGYTPRILADVAIRKDIQNVNLQINGKSHTYEYDARNKDVLKPVENTDGTPNKNTTWDIGVRLSDLYYNTVYSREIHPSDYEYKIEDYNGNAANYGKTEDSELKVYITYKIILKNQSLSVRTRIDEIVDYYDNDLTFDINDDYIKQNSYMEIKIGENLGKYNIYTSNNISKYGEETKTSIDGYGNLYLQFTDNAYDNTIECTNTPKNKTNNIYLKTGETAYLYLTFRVNKDENRNIKLDESNWYLDEATQKIVAGVTTVGKENVVEVNGYSTIYGNGTKVPNVGDVSGKPAGIVDTDSNPGNLNPSDVPKDGNVQYQNFEDDTDKSPNIRLRLTPGQDENRLIDGIAWEDIRDETNKEQKTKVANGLKDDNEEGINGVTVQLVELMDNGTEYVWSNKQIIRNNDGSLNSAQTKYDLEDVYTKNSGYFTPIINMTDNNGNNLITNVGSNTDGYYAFKSFPAGNYVVRFIYGDTIKTVLPNNENTNEITTLLNQYGDNKKSYTGQDYKSTSYQKEEGVANTQFKYNRDGITEYTIDSTSDSAKYVNNESGTFYYDISAFDKIENVSDAKDIMQDSNVNENYKRQDLTLNSRKDVESYSNLNVRNYIAEVLASHEQLQEYYKNDSTIVENLLKELMENTAMTAETGVMNIEIEKATQVTPNQGEYATKKENTSVYKIQHVNLGLEERPKAQLVIDKKVTNVKLTLADGSTLFDATQTATNILWKEHRQYDTGYDEMLLDNNKFGSIANIRQKNATDSRFGLIQLSMDEELMHGATIKISYKITVTNVGEVDYNDDKFYYTGITSDINNVVKTKANQVIDYVANNLQFDANIEENKAWKVIKIADIINNNNDINQNLVNSKLKDEIEKYNTIIVTNEKSKIANEDLVPLIYSEENSKVSDNLVLTQLITSENDSDDLTYRNIVEIVETSNTVGRRNQYSVVGNQNPEMEPQELDSDRAEIVRDLPSFGNAGIYIMIATTIIIASAMLVGGIIFIKKKVLK